mgnify:CR=1 FL=1
MRAAFYDSTGPASEVLQVAELETPEPGAGEVRVRLSTSGVNPSDVKARAGLRSKELPFPRVVPHSDGAGVIDRVGQGVAPARVGERVWVWNALDRVEALARSSPRTRSDVAELAPSMWKGDEGGINRLRAAALSDLGPTAAVNETKVWIEKARG